MSAPLVIIELGCANTASVAFAFERLGVNPIITNDKAIIAKAERLVLPGVGAAGFAMQRIKALDLKSLLTEFEGPLLGICLGQQLLFDSSEEGDIACLGLLKGDVVRLPKGKGLVTPHMGWNQLQSLKEHPLTQGILGDERAYFVHSYAAPVTQDTIATTDYGMPFAAMVARGSIMGAQFHPERSSLVGARILKNFMSLSL